MHLAASWLMVLTAFTVLVLLGSLLIQPMTLEFRAFWPTRTKYLMDNRATLGVIDGEFEIGAVVLGFGLWLRAY